MLLVLLCCLLCLPLTVSTTVQSRGFQTWTVPVRRQDWLRVARGVASAAYWRGQALPALSYGWYLRLVQATVDLAREQSGSEQVSQPDLLSLATLLHRACAYARTHAWTSCQARMA